MLKLDKNDPLERLILQELNGEPVLAETWEDVMDELADEPDCAQILQERGLSAEDVLCEAKRYRTAFRARMSKRNLPLNNRFHYVPLSLHRRKSSLPLHCCVFIARS